MNPLVPAVDPTPLPGPIWLLHLLWVLTFTIHLLMVNAVLGGTILSAVALLRERAGLGQARQGSDADRFGSAKRSERGQAGRGLAGPRLAARVASINTWAISFAITFAIAPLLFMQLLYGRFFYSATILLGRSWLTMLGLLTVAYFLNYIVKRRLKDGGTPLLAVLVQALLFLAIVGIQVAVSVLHQRPERWGAVSDRPWSVLGDPVFVPRYLHFVLAAVAMAGGVLAWWRMRRGEFDGEVRFGIQAALGATALQLPVGFWMLFALPREVLLGFMKGGPGTMMPLTLGILTGVGAIAVLALCLSPLAKPRLVRHAMELTVGTMVLMVITRHQLRGVYLAVENRGASGAVVPQWGVIGLFLLCLLGVAGLIGMVLRRAVRDRPGPSGDAA
jgi:hypothetical protein